MTPLVHGETGMGNRLTGLEFILKIRSLLFVIRLLGGVWIEEEGSLAGLNK